MDAVRRLLPIFQHGGRDGHEGLRVAVHDPEPSALHVDHQATAATEGVEKVGILRFDLRDSSDDLLASPKRDFQICDPLDVMVGLTNAFVTPATNGPAFFGMLDKESPTAPSTDGLKLGSFSRP